MSSSEKQKMRDSYETSHAWKTHCSVLLRHNLNTCFNTNKY